ncbi:MAG TPA: IS110 family transposase [Croceibacterium sp.]
MFVGIDVHKHAHAAALIDERGGELGTLTIPNSPEGYRRLLDWLDEHDAEQPVVGVESPGSYGRRLVGALAAAGLEVLHVPAWRTHRERHRQGAGKTDPGDALAIADVVRHKRRELGPALEPELVRAWRCSSCSAAASSAIAPKRSSGCAPTGRSSTRSPRPA